MNQRQKKCLWVAIAVFVLMGLFPPWQKDYGRFSSSGYTFIFEENRRPIDINLLAVQWILVAVVTGGLMLTFRGKEAGKPEARQEETHQPPQDETHTQ